MEGDGYCLFQGPALHLTHGKSVIWRTAERKERKEPKTLHCTKLHNLFFPPNIFYVIKLKIWNGYESGEARNE
jgi:hypothetical protein